MRAAAVAGAAALLVALGGCGSGDDDDGPVAEKASSGEVVDISGTEPVGDKLGGSVAQLVTCRDWKGASEDERLATIADVRSQLAPQDSGIELPQLTDEEAMEVFDSSCRPEWAGGFRLYKLYAQAAGFVTLKRDLEETGGR